MPPQRILPAESTVAAGFVEVAAECADPGGYAAPLALTVPDGWEARGLGSAGGGSPLTGNVDLTFSTPEGNVVVGIDHDSVGPDGTVLVNGEPFESFDYDYETFSSSGEDGSGTISFEKVADVSVGDQEVELWVADQAQGSSFSSMTEHKARVRTADLTNPARGDSDGLTPASMVISVSHDAESTDVSTDDVAGIVAGLALPDCAWAQEVARLEMTFGEDLDGDGSVATPQDLFGD